MVGAMSDLVASKATILFARFPPFEPFSGAMVKINETDETEAEAVYVAKVPAYFKF